MPQYCLGIWSLVGIFANHVCYELEGQQLLKENVVRLNEHGETKCGKMNLPVNYLNYPYQQNISDQIHMIKYSRVF